ncbi:hypothetical protein, partial [Halorubrum persicum]|uniref:hypothetical protein n=1 Tax=Halorubrum persicum TaxID=1383844 RepID=UPI0011818640
MSAPDCTLCELPTDGVDVVDDDGNEFCCTGCRDVYETLGDADVDAVRRELTERAVGRAHGSVSP